MEPSRARARTLRALVVLMYFALAAVSSFFNDFEAVEMSAIRVELARQGGKVGVSEEEQYQRVLAAHNRWLDHQRAIRGTVRPPLRYRPLSFWMTELARRAFGSSVLHTDFYLRMLLLFLCCLAFHGYMRRWLDLQTTALGVVVFLALMPMVYWRGYHKLYDFTNLLIFIAGYWLIRERKDSWLVPLLVVGMVNRETAVMLVAVYFFVRWGELPGRRLLLGTGLLGLLSVGVYVGLRLAYGYESWFHWNELRENPVDPQTYIFLFLFLNAFWVLAFLDWKRKPRFLRRAMLMVPVFFAIHFVVGYVREVRLFLPLLPLFIPLGLLSFRGGRVQRGAGAREPAEVG